MSIVQNPFKVHSHQYFQLQQDVVSLNFQNGSTDLYHFVIFDYEQWRQSEEDDHTLFSLDNSSDAMDAAHIDFPSSPNNLYLARAYFETGETKEMIFTLRNPSFLNLPIAQFHDGPAFAQDPSYQSLTQQDADLLI